MKIVKITTKDENSFSFWVECPDHYDPLEIRPLIGDPTGRVEEITITWGDSVCLERGIDLERAEQLIVSGLLEHYPDAAVGVAWQLGSDASLGVTAFALDAIEDDDVLEQTLMFGRDYDALLSRACGAADAALEQLEAALELAANAGSMTLEKVAS